MVEPEKNRSLQPLRESKGVIQAVLDLLFFDLIFEKKRKKLKR